jgi:protein-tyrosine phosphatase
MDVSADGFLAGQLHRAAPVVERVLQEVVSTDGAVMLHCHTGKDRTGFVVAVILAFLGVSDDDIVADYERSRPVFETMLANLAAAGLGIPADAPEYALEAPSTVGIKAMLGRLRSEWPSVSDYLAAHGVDGDLLGEARAVLIVDPSC